eukprot:NODE_743_length_4284_cov_0.513501.p2 type:complete len:273 gc:universal NODE_743_length_4284_cov_0.513501:2253-1435(-)
MKLSSQKSVDSQETDTKLNPTVKTTFETINWQLEQSKDLSLQSLLNNKTAHVQELDGIIYKTHKSGKKLYVPEHLVDSLLSIAHNSNIAAHAGSAQVSIYLKDYYFSGKQTRIRKFVKSCETCLLSKAPTLEHHFKTRIPAQPLHRIYIDFKGPLPIEPANYQEDCKYLFTILDDSTRFINAVPVARNGSKDAILALKRHWIQIFGPPTEIVADNVPFNSKEFRLFLKEEGIEIQSVAPYAHFSNAVERKHRELDVKLRNIHKIYPGQNHFT